MISREEKHCLMSSLDEMKKKRYNTKINTVFGQKRILNQELSAYAASVINSIIIKS